MKNLHLFLVFIFIYSCSRSETSGLNENNITNQNQETYSNYTIGNGPFVYFEDKNLKIIILQNKNINKNYDNEISFVEAKNYSGNIDISFKNIESIVGLEKFENLNALNISSNKIMKVDFSEMKNLQYLDVSLNPFMSLDLSNNNKLISLDITNSKLTHLDLSKNPDLQRVSGQCNYELRSINIKNGNNKKLMRFSFWLNEPVLECIQVDDVNYFVKNFSNEVVTHAKFSETSCFGIE